MHVHVTSADGEAKFWIEPSIELATSHGLSERQLSGLERLVNSHFDEIVESWREHFES